MDDMENLFPDIDPKPQPLVPPSEHVDWEDEEEDYE